MRKFLMPLVAGGVAATALVVPPSASRADDGQVAAGIIGGLAAGALLGAAASQPPLYGAPAPVYVAPPPSCYWTRGEPMWDAYRSAWIRPRIQVCDPAAATGEIVGEDVE
jgi:hypothetical protein